MDEIIKICKRRTSKLKVGHWNMRTIYSQALVYADDILLIAGTEQRLQDMVNEWTETLKSKGMKVNANKSKVMQMGRTEEIIDSISIYSEGKKLEQVKRYEYLGTIVHQNGKIKDEVLNRTRKARNMYCSLSNIIFGKKEIQPTTKLQIYNAIIEPTLLYGSESWPVTEGKISSITAIEMKCYRRIAGKTKRDMIRNERIREGLKQESIGGKLRKRQMKWFGHVLRMDEERKPRQMMEVRTEGRRGRGRPRMSYMDNIENQARERGKGMGELRRMARDRDEWRRWIQADPTP